MNVDDMLRHLRVGQRLTPFERGNNPRLDAAEAAANLIEAALPVALASLDVYIATDGDVRSGGYVTRLKQTERDWGEAVRRFIDQLDSDDPQVLRLQLARHVQPSIHVARDLLESLVDVEDCWLDRDGGCQAHGYLDLNGEPCPQRELKRVLAADDGGGSE